MAWKPYLNQVYESIKDECLKSNKLFVDEKFPPCDKSIDLNSQSIEKKVKWERAKSLSSNSHLSFSDLSEYDLNKGFFNSIKYESNRKNIIKNLKHEKRK